MADASRTSAGDERLGWLDSLRGGAALAIGCFHATVFLFTNALDRAVVGGAHVTAGDLFWGSLVFPARYGYVGFSMFFLVSGFAIHYPIAIGAVPFRFKTFIVRRFFRLYVPYLAALLFGLAVALAIRTEPPIDWTTVLKTVFFVSNYPHAGGPYYEIFHQNVQQNFVLWTVSIEFELYFFYPLLLRAFARLGPVWTLACVAATSFVIATLGTYFDPPPGDPPNLVSFIPAFLPFWVVWATGAALAEARARGRFPRWNAAWLAACVLLGTVILGARALGMPRLYEVLVMGAFCGALFVRFSVEPAGAVARSFMEALRKLGRMSYSYYLFQIPTFYVVAMLWIHTFGAGRITNPLPAFLAIVLAIPVGFASFSFVERPSTRLARFVAKRVG